MLQALGRFYQDASIWKMAVYTRCRPVQRGHGNRPKNRPVKFRPVIVSLLPYANEI